MGFSDAVILLVVGALFVGVPWTFGIQGQQQAVKNADVTVDGTVVSTDLGKHRGQDSGRWKYDATVTYEYTYEGRTYTSTNVYAGPGGPGDYGDRSEAEDFLDQYPVGSTVEVHLNPDDPSRAFLEEESPTPVWGFYAFMGVGGLIALGGLASLGRSIKELAT